MYIFLYTWKTWTELPRRIQTMEMRCCRKSLRISYTDHVTNVEVRTNIKIQDTTGRNKDLLTTVKRRKLKW